MKDNSELSKKENNEEEVNSENGENSPFIRS